MARIRYEWDESKNRANVHKHGLSFQEASQVFMDPLQVSVPDRITDGEERWKTLGMVEHLLLLTVAHTLKEEEEDGSITETILIISAREATAKERPTI